MAPRSVLCAGYSLEEQQAASVPLPALRAAGYALPQHQPVGPQAEAFAGLQTIHPCDVPPMRPGTSTPAWQRLMGTSLSRGPGRALNIERLFLEIYIFGLRPVPGKQGSLRLQECFTCMLPTACMHASDACAARPACMLPFCSACRIGRLARRRRAQHLAHTRHRGRGRCRRCGAAGAAELRTISSDGRQPCRPHMTGRGRLTRS